MYLGPGMGLFKTGEALSEFVSVFKIQMSRYFELERWFRLFSPRFPIKVYFESESVLKLKYLMGLVFVYVSDLTNLCTRRHCIFVRT